MVDGVEYVIFLLGGLACLAFAVIKAIIWTARNK